MAEQETIVFGLPVPSTDKVFLAIVVIHILLGIICVIAGIVAMLCRKGSRTHIWAGKIYYWVLLPMVLTVIPLSIMRWPHNNHLFLLGMLSYLSAFFGRRHITKPAPGGPRLHTTLMGCSYIFLLTAFYVDNGKNLPFWNQFSQLFFWVFPAIIGIPFIIYALLRHPLNRTVPKKGNP